MLMPTELIITIAAGVISLMVFAWLIKVVKTTIGTAVKITILVLSLQLFFGVGPQTLWQHMVKLLQQQGLGWLVGS
jgi:hypothetical protein